MKMAKSAALPANSAKRFARPWRSPSSRMCEESCPVDSIVETNIFDYHGEKKGDLYYTKDMLLAVGDRYEQEIAASKEADAKYR